ncbi:PREDICTED: protein-methionine sulfoxide oxidase MICAL3 [Nanorana parkeri]|uniref:protein-methionine sulfoxide oxidase MICAL3 n=1 Tax=Nanorana parkeri TaxID=125878 RepID=UPI0008541146|nr:PREDICTED: protein-methionine sulfoxide oxidase MICAL3 [Nanorana parkeri]
MEDGQNNKVNPAHVLFDRFVQASTCKGTLKSFQELCDHLELKPRDYRSFYPKLKSKLNYWKAKALWSKLDKRGSHKDYKKGKACSNTKCLIIGAGPCGLRTAIELCFLGAKVVVIEKRDAFSRNNVLHLWPFTIHDLRSLGAKKFHGKFCAGAIDHISIRQLQLILLKVSLILGIEIHVNVEFQGLVEPPEDQENERTGWRATVFPKGHPVSEFDFDVIIGADGRRNTLAGFRRKEFRGKLAIAITANFINRNTTAEAKVEEISGVAFIFNQKFFQDLREATGIDLENIVYYKDDTHYFVMTAKKQSLLEKGVILQDYADTEMLLSRANVDQEALLNYATEAARFSTNQQLPNMDFAINHYGQPDVAMFDFTCMYASENAALVRERYTHRLLVALVGDSLLEPFWPMGTGIARGFLAAMDSAWMVRSWAHGASPLEVLAERESIYRLLPQTTPENVSKNFSLYSVDPTTRYPNVNLQFLRPSQVRHLYNTTELKDLNLEISNFVNAQRTPKLGRNESVARSSKLLGWCQKQTEGYAGVNVTDLTMSWKSGLALCAIIHRYRPELIDFDTLDERDVEKNNQLALDIAERELGISPIMTGKEMASVGEPDKLSMVVYLSQFYEMFKETPVNNADPNADEKAALLATAKSPISFLSKLGQTISRKRTPKDKKEKEVDSSGKRRKTSQSEDEEGPRTLREEHPSQQSSGTDRKLDAAANNQNRVKSMATQLLAKFEENAPAPNTGLRKQKPLLPYQQRLLEEAALRHTEPQWKQPRINDLPRTCPKKVISLYSRPSPVPHPLTQSSPVPPGDRGETCPSPERFDVDPAVHSPVDQWQHSISLCSTERPASPSYDEIRQKYIKIYTGGVSSLAEQIANQLQKKETPKPLFGKKVASFRKEFPQNIGGSDVCYFCHRRVYVMERLSAEGKFFHRSCFKCDYCNTTLRLSAYAYDLEDGKFYCKPHYCYRRSGYSQRKRAAEPALTNKEIKGTAKDTPDAEEPGRGAVSPVSSLEKTPGPSLNGVEDHSLAKRLRATPERIELENYRVSMQKEDLEEVPEETLAEHNLSSLLDKDREDEEEAASSSSESEMEEDEEHQPPSDLGGVPWKEAVKIHAKLKGKNVGEVEAEGALEAGDSEEEEEDEESEEEEEEPSSEEGDYCPWERELQHGLWLHRITDEDTVGTFKAGNIKLQQTLSPVDPMEIKADVHWTHVHKVNKEQEGEEVGMSSQSKALKLLSHRHDPVRTWLESVSGGRWDDAEADVLGSGLAEAEAGGDGDTSADLGDLDDDIPSDAEAEERLQQAERLKLKLDEDLELEVVALAQQGRASLNLILESERPPSPVAVTPQAAVLSPIRSPKEDAGKASLRSPLQDLTSPEVRFFPEPFLPQTGKKVMYPSEQKPQTSLSPVCSQPVAMQEPVIPTSPMKSPSLQSLGRPLRTPTLPICSQPLPSTEPAVPTSTTSPVCLQPSPVITSTPLAKLPYSGDELTSPNAEEAMKRIDLIEEFWMKSAEIRRSLGLAPVDRSQTPEMSFPAIDTSAARTQLSKSTPKELKSPSPKPQKVHKKMNPNRLDFELLSPLTPISPSEKELKSSEGEKKDLSTSSGLGLNGSHSNTRTVASESFNTSDSAMLTPPSSPPPPPPQGEEPATLRRSLASWQNGPEAAQTPLEAQVKRPEVSKPTQRLEEARKSFVESVDEIPFADDVEDTYDERTENSSLQERFYTPPTSQRKPPNLALTKENGELPTSLERGHHRKKGLPQVTPEVKELAEERMRAREKSVKNQALRDAMAQQLMKMKHMETVPSTRTSRALGSSSTKLATDLPTESSRAGTHPEASTLRLENSAEVFLSPPVGSITSSEGSGGKPKKRPSLFSPRKKEKKPKGEANRLSDKPDEVTKPKSLWKSVFSGYKKEKKKKTADDKSTPSTPSSSTTVDSGKVKVPSVLRGAELPLRRHLSFSEDSDLSSDDVLEKSSQKSKRESVYVPHALAFRRSYSSKKTYTDEELNAKLTKRVQKAARRQAKQEELKRLHRAQIIQRQLEQVEEKQRQLEERGVAVEKALRGEADYWGESYYSDLIDLHLGVDPIVGTPRRRPISFCPCCAHEGMGKKDDPKLMQEWFRLVQEKNALVRYESELMIFARELELEDRQSRLQQELRERMAVEDHLKTEQELADEKKILNEMLDVVEQRDALVALLEEQRLREKEEDKDLEEVMLSKGYNLNWS